MNIVEFFTSVLELPNILHFCLLYSKYNLLKLEDGKTIPSADVGGEKIQTIFYLYISNHLVKTLSFFVDCTVLVYSIDDGGYNEQSVKD